MELIYRNPNFKRFHRWINRYGKRANAGMILLIVALVTMIIANSPLRFWYESLWTIEITLGIPQFNILSHGGHNMTLLDFVNDTLMALFFFAVGLEIKREILVGELSSFRQVMLPFLAACGGMIFPVLFFFITGKIQHFSPEELRGVAIPMATDIAFSLGVLSLFGKRVPIALKVFLLAFAIVDDIGGIIIIALFYSDLSTYSALYLGISLLVFGVLFLGNRLRVNSKGFYGVFGVIIWYLFLQAGIHPTIAGVLVAFTIPARPYLNIKNYVSGLQRDIDLIKSTTTHSSRATSDDILLSNIQINYLSRVERASDRAISPLQDMEDNLGGIVNYFIMPLFAFANAGVVFNFSGGFEMFSGITLSVLVGLLLGKSIGIFSFTWLAIKFRICRLPMGVTWRNLFGVCLLGGIGFTVALFLASLSYPVGSDYLNQAKLGIVLGSFLSGAIGYLYLNKVLPKNEKKKK